ncbi:hypothetical protein C1X65_04115 [Pseudomonas sp. FW305-70]|nr:hypothetical protein C1X65_04115 [Pseudomonas sp. FW305-70]
MPSLIVGASLLAMVVNDVADPLGTRGVLEPIASRLAPTQSFTDQHSAQGPRFFFAWRKAGTRIE